MHLAMRGVYLFPKKSDTRFFKADGWSIVSWSIVSLPGVDGYSLIEWFTNDSVDYRLITYFIYTAIKFVSL